MAIEQAMGAIGLGLFQLIVGLILAIACIYVGFSLFNKILKEIDLQEELKKGNTSGWNCNSSNNNNTCRNN